MVGNAPLYFVGHSFVGHSLGGGEAALNPKSAIRNPLSFFCLKTLYFLAIRKLRLSTTQRNRGVRLHIEGVFSNDRFGLMQWL